MSPPQTGLPREILLVDDDRGLSELIRRHLQRSGIDHRIEILGDAASAWRHLVDCEQRGALPALCLLDIDMPGAYDGKELLRRVKRQPSLRHIPIVMLSGSDLPRQVLECYVLGCNLYLSKTGAELSELMERLGRCLEVVQLA